MKLLNNQKNKFLIHMKTRMTLQYIIQMGKSIFYTVFHLYDILENYSDREQISGFQSLRVGEGAGFGFKEIAQENFWSDETVLYLHCGGGKKHLSKLIELDTKK